jgi:hypothetical protein
VGNDRRAVNFPPAEQKSSLKRAFFIFCCTDIKHAGCSEWNNERGNGLSSRTAYDRPLKASSAGYR